MEALESEANRLLEASLAKSSRITYNRGVKSFDEFRLKSGIECVWPSPMQHIIAFIAQLSLEGKASSTIDTYVSALSYMHKIEGWEDPTDNFIVKKLREGSRRQNKHSDNRRPITIAILQQLSSLLPNLCSSSYETHLFRTSFLLAFFGFLRVGEFTTASKKGEWANILLPSDVSFSKDKSLINLRIRSSKTDQRGEGATLQIGTGHNQEVCPVKAMSKYLEMRPICEGLLFIHFGGEPLTRYQFGCMLKKGIGAIGLSPGDFNTHSFRIGAATSAAVGGIPLDQIMSMGRWRSSAVNSYIRPLRFITPCSWVL